MLIKTCKNEAWPAINQRNRVHTYPDAYVWENIYRTLLETRGVYGKPKEIYSSSIPDQLCPIWPLVMWGSSPRELDVCL